MRSHGWIKLDTGDQEIEQRNETRQLDETSSNGLEDGGDGQEEVSATLRKKSCDTFLCAQYMLFYSLKKWRTLVRF